MGVSGHPPKVDDRANFSELEVSQMLDWVNETWTMTEVAQWPEKHPAPRRLGDQIAHAKYILTVRIPELVAKGEWASAQMECGRVRGILWCCSSEVLPITEYDLKHFG